jgi:hypothetical protein
MFRLRQFLLVFVAIGSLCGMLRPGATLVAGETEGSSWRPGIVFVVEGIGGFDFMGQAVHWALPHAGVPHEIRIFNWSHGKGQFLKDLQDTRNMLQKADQLAAEIVRAKENDPGRPIYLVGKSGGTGLVLAAVHNLPPGTIERIILLSAAVSPDYDLRPALRATRGEVVSFYSGNDQLVLGWGTRKFGTIDRVYGPSAGLTGFHIPSDLPIEERALYERLVQIPWRAGMIREGNLGTHAGTSMPSFLGKEVAPWLKP